MRASPLFWLLDIEAYDFDIGVLKDTYLKGKALIISTQLWSIIRENTVLSVLIGPGIFKGVAESRNRRIDVIENISALMFDPTQLRMDEPVPIVDIVNPEVIDPLSTKKPEDIVTLIRNVVSERGNVLSGNPVFKMKPAGSIPRVVHALDVLKKIRVSHVSGTQRAKFVLAGTNGPLYKPFVEFYNSRGYINPDRIKVMAQPFSKMTSFVDIEVMSDWMIVEKAGMDNTTGIEGIRHEYEQTLDEVRKHESQFVYEL